MHVWHSAHFAVWGRPQLLERSMPFYFTQLADAKARSGFRELPELRHDEFVWPDLESPESATRVGQAIDQMFRNTDNETKTESLSAFLLSFEHLQLLVEVLGEALSPNGK